MLVQSGKPVGVFKTHADAPRVLRQAHGSTSAARALCRALTRPSRRWGASTMVAISPDVGY
jgi:hypothetical protein